MDTNKADITATINGDTNKFEVCGEKSQPLCFSQLQSGYSTFGNKCRGICYTSFPSCDRSVGRGALERVKSWVGACSAYRPNDHPPRLLLPCTQASTLQCGLFILTNGMLPCHQCLRNSHPSIHRLLDSRGYELKTHGRRISVSSESLLRTMTSTVSGAHTYLNTGLLLSAIPPQFVQGFHALMSTSDTRTSSRTIFVIMIEVGPSHPLVFFSDRCPLLPTDKPFMKPLTS